jgi:hypothetical protein
MAKSKNPIFQDSLEFYTDKRLTERHAIVYGATGFLMTRILGGDGLAHDTVLEVPARFRYPHKVIEPDVTLGKTETELAEMRATCPECGRTFPRSRVFWYFDRKGRDGLYSKCVDCKRETEKLRQRKKRAR